MSTTDRLQRARKIGRQARRGIPLPPPPEEMGDSWEGPEAEPSPTNGTPTAGTMETINGATLATLQLPEPRWAIDTLLPEGLSILAGPPKLGKSWLALALGVAVASGGTALGKIKVEIGDVLYLALEDTKRRLQSRLKKLAASPPRLHLATRCPRQGNGGLESIDQWIAKHPEARMVIIDTWARFRPPANGKKEDHYARDYADATEVKQLADKFGIAIVLVHHTRKRPGGIGEGDQLEAISGTQGLTGAADGALVLTRERGQADASLFVTGRDIDEQDLALKWDPATCHWFLLGTGDEYRISRQRAEILEVLRKEEKPMAIADIATALGKKRESIKQLLWLLKIDGWVSANEKGHYEIRQGGGEG